MTALRKILIEEEAVTNVVAANRAPRLYVVTNEAPAEAEAAGGLLKNIALFLAAPFIGLVYIIALPFVGIAAVALLTARAAAKFAAVRAAGDVLRAVGAALAAPAIGLAFVVFSPLIGLGALAWIAGKAATAKN
jgi:hypothetical protein